MADVFISYHEASAGELAQKIADALDAAGISCWCARRDMPLGDDFARHIPKQIQNCRLFLLVLNNNVYNSRHIENEVGLAFRRLNQRKDIIILPIETPDFELDDGEWIAYYLIQIQSAKLPGEDEAHIRELVQIIAARLGRKPQEVAQLTPVMMPQPQKLPSKNIKRGKCGNTVYYTLDKNGVLTISGKGSMWSFSFHFYYPDTSALIPDTPWWNEREMISHVEIRNGVTGIGSGAFYDCENLKSVNIPDSVKFIKEWAFADCKNLQSISILEGTERNTFSFPPHIQVIEREKSR